MSEPRLFSMPNYSAYERSRLERTGVNKFTPPAPPRSVTPPELHPVRTIELILSAPVTPPYLQAQIPPRDSTKVAHVNTWSA
jgi:hypothetical protein